MRARGGERFTNVYRGGSSMQEGESDNTALILISVFILAIIVGSIGYGSFYYRRENFEDSRPSTAKYTLQYYCMPNCGYCNDFDPVWQQLVTEVSANPTQFNFTTIKYMITDNGEGKASATKYNINSTPSVLLVKKDNPNTYFIFNDKRDLATLKAFANKNAV
jgi:hypothetical protein